MSTATIHRTIKLGHIRRLLAGACSDLGGNPMTQEGAEGAAKLIMCCIAAMEVTNA